MSNDTTFPSITFPATFEGTAAIGGDFSATLKFKTADGPKVLEDLKSLTRGTYDVTIVSRQGALTGDSTDREWASMDLQQAEDSELEYAERCIGGSCPHFSVPGSGDLAGHYVCGFDPDAPMVLVAGETPCPLWPQAVAEETEASPADAVVNVAWPDDALGAEFHATEVGPLTRYYGELAADFLASLPLADPRRADDVEDYRVIDANGDAYRDLNAVIIPDDYGLMFRVEPAAMELVDDEGPDSEDEA